MSPHSPFILAVQLPDPCSYLHLLAYPQICAGGVTGEDTCSGDSGGPLVATGKAGGKYFLIGLTSYGPLLCGRNGSFGVYTAVHKYRDWIVQTLAV
jgi:secreted trypsin-like serine protease